MDIVEGVVVPVVEVDRATDLDRTRQVVAAAIGAFGDLDRRAGSRRPIADIRRPRLRGHGAHTALGDSGDTQPGQRAS